jgi:protein CpxP
MTAEEPASWLTAKRKSSNESISMKRSTRSILSITALGALMACAGIARAQDNSPETTAPPEQNADVSGAPRRGAGGTNGIQAIVAKLKLTPEQRPKFLAALKDQRQQMSALRENGALTQEERRPKAREIMDATDAKLKTILTPEQFAEWQKDRPMARVRAGNRNKAGADAGTNAPPTTPNN